MTTEKAQTLCIYHGNCADGFTSAWIVEQAREAGLIEEDIEYLPAFYGKPLLESVTGRDIIMVDFSFPREVMKYIMRWANSTLVLDHHKTAEAALKGLNDPTGMPNLPTYMGGYRCSCCFDMNRSGAGLTWDHFFPGNRRPNLVNYVEDRDLWRFKLPKSRVISANLFSYEYTFDAWSIIASELESTLSGDTFILAGEAIERKHHKDIAELLAINTHSRLIGGQTVPCANLPYTLASDACHALLEQYKDAPFAASFFFNDKMDAVFSLRSEDSRMDVSEIAKKYGGGGHRNAAGFTVPWDQFGYFGVFTQPKTIGE